MTSLLLVVVSWAAGMMAYLAALRAFYGQDISSGDLAPTFFWSLLAWCIVSFVALLPVFRWLQRRGGWSMRPATLGLAGLAACFLPTALVLGVWGGLTLGDLVSPEAILFEVLFGVSGVILGVGYAALRKRAA